MTAVPRKSPGPKRAHGALQRGKFRLDWALACSWTGKTDAQLTAFLAGPDGKRSRTVDRYKGRQGVPIQEIARPLVDYLLKERPPEVQSLLDEISEWAGAGDAKWQMLRHLVEVTKLAFSQATRGPGPPLPDQLPAGAHG